MGRQPVTTADWNISASTGRLLAIEGLLVASCSACSQPWRHQPAKTAAALSNAVGLRAGCWWCCIRPSAGHNRGLEFLGFHWAVADDCGLAGRVVLGMQPAMETSASQNSRGARKRRRFACWTLVVLHWAVSRSQPQVGISRLPLGGCGRLKACWLRRARRAASHGDINQPKRPRHS